MPFGGSCGTLAASDLVGLEPSATRAELHTGRAIFSIPIVIEHQHRSWYPV